jgi:hypothetical protein
MALRRALRIEEQSFSAATDDIARHGDQLGRDALDALCQEGCRGS